MTKNHFKISLSIFFASLFLLLISPAKTYAANFCNVATLTHDGATTPPQTQNTTYTITLDQCNFGGIGGVGLYVDVVIRPQNSTNEIYRKMVVGASQALPHSSSFGNFLTLDEVNAIGQDPGQGQFFNVYLELKGIGGTLFDTMQPNPPVMQILYTGGQAQCGATIPNDGTVTCPSNCPAVDRGNSTSVCTVPPTQAPPESCAISNEVAQRTSNNQWFLGAIVDGRNLKTDKQYIPVAIRTNHAANPGRDYYFPSPFTGGDVHGSVGMNNGEWQVGDTIVIAILSSSCSTPSVCPQICRSKDIPLQATIPTLPPNTTPIPTGFDNIIPTIMSQPPGWGAGGSLFQVQTCNTADGTAGIQTGLGCIATTGNGLFKQVFTLAIGMAGGIAFLLIIMGGLRILTSAANPESMNEGREIISSAIIGLILIIFSVFILRFIGVNIFCIPGFSGGGLQC